MKRATLTRAAMITVAAMSLAACAADGSMDPGYDDAALHGDSAHHADGGAHADAARTDAAIHPVDAFVGHDAGPDGSAPCLPGTSQRSYPGDGALVGVGRCVAGTQQCVGEGEFGTWGECVGAVLPGVEDCSNHIDDDCNGVVDDGAGCVCAVGDTRPCYSGPAGTEGVGICAGGTERCTDGTAWDACHGDTVPRAEICGNHVDDNCNGQVDEGCTCIGASGSPWQIERSRMTVCWGYHMPNAGDPMEFNYASIPSETDSGWGPVGASTIDFHDPSRLDESVCACQNGGDFTYFQTFVDVPAGLTVHTMTVSVHSVDDGGRVTINGHDAGDISMHGGSLSVDVARYMVPGHNRLVITHVDDCPSIRALNGVQVTLNGAALGSCSL